MLEIPNEATVVRKTTLKKGVLGDNSDGSKRCESVKLSGFVDDINLFRLISNTNDSSCQEEAKHVVAGNLELKTLNVSTVTDVHCKT